jgi:RimJ/RimL family protein N-acetyltransferase
MNAIAPIDHERATVVAPPNGLALKRIRPREFALAAEWLADPKVNKWLYFGNDRQALTAPQLAGMCANPCNRIWLIHAGAPLEPVGMIGLNDLNMLHKTAGVWMVRTVFNRAHGRRLMERSILAILKACFYGLRLNSVSTWVVATNRYSISIVRGTGGQLVGSMRSSHVIAGKCEDRILFDMTKEDLDPAHCAEIEAVEVEL